MNSMYRLSNAGVALFFRKTRTAASSSIASKSSSLFRFPHCRLCLAARSVRSFSTSKTGQDHHAFFQEQLQELEKERSSFFGEDNGELGENSQSHTQEGRRQKQSAFFEQEMLQLENERKEVFGEDASSSLPDQDLTREDLKQMHSERDALFDFSAQERQAWGNAGLPSDKVSAERMLEISEARAAVERGEDLFKAQETKDDEHHESFSHVSPDGASVHMVDVGHKDVTTRMAQAQAKVILPDEVLRAFALSLKDNELVGPKGPILATAKLAGIMAAKKTSDLIPLCHPLPLEQVTIDIRLQGNEVIIDCTCRVTHKTGVEMEALTGASVAALTVYDMVKAVSHQVQITDTRLISKTGGKRTVQNDPN